MLLLVLLTIQITLGALTVLSGQHFIINSLHVVTGASVLVTSLVLTLRAHRARFGDDRRTRAMRTAAAWQAASDRRRRARRSRQRARGGTCRRPAARSRVALRDFVTLTKPRLNLLVLVTTLAGLYLASPDGVPARAARCTRSLGTALVAGGAAALNQAWERETDRLMRRTSAPAAARRPPPRSPTASWFGIALSAAGLVELAFGGRT